MWLRKFSQEKNFANAYRSFLSIEEIRLAERRATEDLRREALVSFGLRRKILADLLNVSPATLVFDQQKHGKPALKKYPLHFNVSHSGDFWVMLTDDQHPVGIDVEDTQREVEFKALAQRFFTSKEADLVKNDNNPAEVFWHLWTGKEALLKATGEGIVEGLTHVEILRDRSGKYFIANPLLAAQWHLQWLPFETHGLIALATSILYNE